MSNRGIFWRCVVCAGLCVVMFAGLGCRLAFLHVGPHARELAQATTRNRESIRNLIADRGHIYDRRGAENILAMSVGAKDIAVDPILIAKNDAAAEVATFLAEQLALPERDILKRLSDSQSQFKYIKRFVLDDEAGEILDHKMPGVILQDTTVRHYPQNRFMCHVLGFVNHEGTGSAGIEQAMDRYLKGSPGLVEGGVNALRKELYSKRRRYVAPIEGANIQLTLDQHVQYFVEKALDEVVEQYGAKGAWALVQRVRTGEILAMASRPTYDPNEFRLADKDDMLNRTIGCVYEPGSTFKAVTFSAALNEGIVTPKDTFNCENGQWLYRGKILRDYHPYGVLTVADGVKKSSNIMSAKIAIQLGDKRFHEYMKKFGIGDPMGIDLPGEERGILHDYKKWSAIDGSRIAIGQSVAVTALQMLGVMCTIANDGFMMRPYVTRRVVAWDGSVLLDAEPVILGRPISVQTAQTMRALLQRVTEEGGTGRRARVEGYAVAGKTGTAQKPEGGGYSSTAHIASFAGFLPADNPEIGIIVVVDEPQPVRTGGTVAAPVFGHIADQVIRYLDVPSEPVHLVQR